MPDLYILPGRYTEGYLAERGSFFFMVYNFLQMRISWSLLNTLIKSYLHMKIHTRSALWCNFILQNQGYLDVPYKIDCSDLKNCF